MSGSKVKKEISKKQKLIYVITSCCLAVIVALSILIGVLLGRRLPDHFSAPELNLPNEESFALNKYNYDELDATLTTVRSDIMNVTKRGLKRSETKPLSDVYSILNDSYVETPDEDATIDFKGIYPSAHNPGYSVNANVIAANFADEANAMFPGDSEAAVKYLYYYKYMLLSQGYNLALDAQKLSAKTVESDAAKQDFINWLAKHPAADAQYGACVGEDNAVEKEITIDPIYRSPHVTGLYLPAGEAVTVKVEGLKDGESLGITIGLQNSLAWAGEAANTGFSNNTGKHNFFFNADIRTKRGEFKNDNNFKRDDKGRVSGHKYIQSQWARQNARLPWLIADFSFDKNGTYVIGTPFGGIIHINPKSCFSNAKTTITGAVEMPHYVLGITTPTYFDTYLRNAPGPGAVLDAENGQLICAYGNAMRTVKTEEIDKLAMLWHSFFAVNESFTGGTYNRFNKVMFDIHVPAGAAVSLGNYSFACPTGWFNGAMNYRGLIAGGTWGTLHEIGHNHGGSYGSIWGFGDGHEGEVRNNALTVLAYIMLCDTGTSVANKTSGVEHGEVCHPYTSLTRFKIADTVQDFANISDYFKYLSMYTNIMHSFGAEKFYELLYTYKDFNNYVDENVYNELNKNDATKKFIKRADFAYRCSLVYGMNFLNYFNKLFKANLNQNMFSTEQWNEMHTLPNYEPIASLYAGGIDDVKTGGDWLVTYGKDVEFDFLANTVSSLDTAEEKGFQILSVSKPEHGSIQSLGDGKYAYKFNDKYGGTFDNFSVKVKMKDGVVHDLRVTLRITYPSLKSYSNVGTVSSAKDIANKIANITPEVETITQSGIPAYTVEDDNTVAKKTEYYWVAPKTGKLTFSFKYNKGLHFYFGESFNNITSQAYYSISSENWIKFNKTYSVEEGKKYAIRLINYNNGGEGFANIAYTYEGEELTEIPFEELYLPKTQNVNLEEYKHEPSFIVSKKDGIKVGNNATTKSEWKVLKAVTNGTDTAEDNKYIDGGREDAITRTDIINEENIGEIISDENTTIVNNGNGTYTVTYKTKQDKWNYLIDGDTSTYLHTAYGKNDIKYCNQMPYEFVIDTGHIQQFNYFSVITRNGAIGISKVTKFELQISNDNFVTDIRTLAEGDLLEYAGTVAKISFENVEGRYFKLIAKDSTGNRGKFVVIAELDAGLTSYVQRLVPATSNYLFSTKNWVNTNTLDAEQNGYLMTNKTNEKLVFRFYGKQLSLYAAAGENFGMADLKIDGKKVLTLNFNNPEYVSRKLMAFYDNLENKEHTVEIITKNNGRVMINMFGIEYTAGMLNAPNIYLEKGLIISLIVFIMLFIIITAFVLCLLFIPKFRKFMGNNKAINKLDVYMANKKEKNKIKKAEKNNQKQIAKNKELTNAEKKETKTENVKKPAVSSKKTVVVKQSSKPAQTKNAVPENKLKAEIIKNKNAASASKTTKPVNNVKTSAAKPVAKPAVKTNSKPVANSASKTIVKQSTNSKTKK